MNFSDFFSESRLDNREIWEKMKSLWIWEATEEKKNPNKSPGNLRDSHYIGAIWTRAALNESCPQMSCIPRGPIGFSGSHLRKRLLSNPGIAESIMVIWAVIHQGTESNQSAHPESVGFGTKDIFIRTHPAWRTLTSPSNMSNACPPTR